MLLYLFLDTDGCIAQALLLGNIEAAVELCLESNRMADALIIAMTGNSNLKILPIITVCIRGY